MVDICLIPEVKFELAALTQYVKEVMKRKGHCVVCIAEGAGQDIVQHGHTGTDKSGNPILKDIGTHLRDVFKESIQVCLSPLWHAAFCPAAMSMLLVPPPDQQAMRTAAAADLGILSVRNAVV